MGKNGKLTVTANSPHFNAVAWMQLHIYQFHPDALCALIVVAAVWTQQHIVTVVVHSKDENWSQLPQNVE